MDDLTSKTQDELIPLAFQDSPALIEAIFPSQKISFEAQRERKAGAGQVLASLGAYWKGRKPLILVRAITLASLLPQTENLESDLEIFEKLMAIDNEGLTRRAFAKNSMSPATIAALIELDNPWEYFSYSVESTQVDENEVKAWVLPLDSKQRGISIRWIRGISDNKKLSLFRKAIASFGSYEEKANAGKRPEEVDQQWLYESVWSDVNRHYAKLGISAFSHHELIEQLGIIRFGHRPRIGDTFSGGGSIPFEAARIGCDVYAADLNPIACMLTWGSLNIAGVSSKDREVIANKQKRLVQSVDEEIARLGIERDENGNEAKAFLYCLETRCPETGFMVPLAPSWVISKKRRVIAKLIPDHVNKRFDIEIVSNVSSDELDKAKIGTIFDGNLKYVLNEKTFTTPIKTLRGDYRDEEGKIKNSVREWAETEFKPASDDIFQERLYAIQWISENTLNTSRKITFFSSVSEADLERERKVESIVQENLKGWQLEGLVPSMEIEPGGPPRYQGKSLISNLGWKYWHQVFNPRQLLVGSILKKKCKSPESIVLFARTLNRMSKLCMWEGPSGYESTSAVFTNQALNELNNWGVRGWAFLRDVVIAETTNHEIHGAKSVTQAPSTSCVTDSDIWITDPPYANAVMYHEITDFFIAWLRSNPPAPFDQWTWDSRRALAIKGSGDDFRRSMVDSYRTMKEHMPANGLQTVMFTHQDSGVWSDMVGIFWASDLQVVASWYIATETSSELKKGGHVQGTVILILKKRSLGKRAGFKQRILPAVRTEVQRQIETMMHLNDEVKDKLGEPVFNDSDLQMAGYAAALKVLTSYTSIGDEDVTSFALRPRQRGEITVVDEIVQQAAEAANSLLVPEGLSADAWAKLSGIQRFYLRMMDMETTGASKLDNYQNFAKAFRVEDYTRVMGNMAANKARLKHVVEFTSRDLTESTEIGATWLGRIIIGLQQLQNEIDPQIVISQLQAEMPDFIEIRPLLIDMLTFIERKASEPEVRSAAEVLSARLRNLRALSQ